MLRNFLASSCLLGLLLASTAHSAIVVSIEPNVSFSSSGGIRTLNVLANATAGESLIGITADIEIGGAIFTIPPGKTGLDADATSFIGFGNLNAASSFTRDGGNQRVAALSLDFNAPQLFPASNGILASLSFDTTSLLPGFYPITLLDVTASTASASFQATKIDGGFSIVPEPTSMLLLGVVGLVGVSQRRFRQRASVAL